jgi:hypothetical protein
VSIPVYASSFFRHDICSRHPPIIQFFYVSSILLNPLIDQPRPESTNYILESLPYLLGSGGTLLFDTSIVIQFFVYGSAPPLPQDAPQPWLNSQHNKRTAGTSERHASRLRRGYADDLEADGEGSAALLGGSGGGEHRQRTRSTSTTAAGGRSPLLFTISKSRSRSQSGGMMRPVANGTATGEDALGLRGIVSGMGGHDSSVEGLPYTEGGNAYAAAPPRSRERTASGSAGAGLRESVIMEESGSGGSGGGRSGSADSSKTQEGKLIDA